MSNRTTEDFKCLEAAGKLADAIVANKDKSVQDITYNTMCGMVPRKTIEQRIAEMSPEEREAAEMFAQFATEYGGLFAGGFSGFKQTKRTYEGPPPEPVAYQAPLPELPKKSAEFIEEEKAKKKALKECFKEAEKVGSCIKNLTDSRDPYRLSIATGLCMCGDVMVKRERRKEAEGVQLAQTREITVR